MTDGKEELVASDERLARFILHRSHLRQDWTVKPDAFIPHPWPDLSVTRQLQLSEPELWNIAKIVASKRKRLCMAVSMFEHWTLNGRHCV